MGAAAAAATSTLNPVAGNNFAYVASYTTQAWTGNLEARGINTVTGVVNENANWCVETISRAQRAAGHDRYRYQRRHHRQVLRHAQPRHLRPASSSARSAVSRSQYSPAGTMNARSTTNSTDTRGIKTASGGTTPTLVEFDSAYASIHSAAVVGGMTQWPVATDPSSDAIYFRANAIGDNLVKYLRGQMEHE